MTTEDKKLYQEYLKREEWKAKRIEILDRDEYACRNCGSREELQVHHRQYHRDKVTKEILPPWKYDEENLITLCQTCHQEGHAKFKVPVFEVILTYKSVSL